MPESRTKQEWVQGNPLRLWRKRERVNFRRAAELLGVIPHSIMNWEHGRFRPAAGTMASIAALIGKRQIELECLWTDWWKNRP